MRIPVVMLCGLLFLLCSSCKDNSVRPKEDEKPIGRGDSTWYYSWLEPYGPIDTAWVDFLGNMKIRVEGEEYTALKQSGIKFTLGTDSTEIFHLSWDGPDGSYAMGECDSYDTIYTKLLKYKYPARAGEAYEFREFEYAPDYSFLVSNEVLTMKVVAVDTLIQTPAGTFKCNHYQYSRRPANDVAAIYQYNFFYAPHIGLIGGRTTDSGNGLVQEFFLIKREQNH